MAAAIEVVVTTAIALSERKAMKNIEDIPLSVEDRDAIEEAARLLRERYPIDEVILFGSKARGTDDEESDIDLLLLTSRKLSRQEEVGIIDMLYEVEIKRSVIFNTMILSSEEWTEGIYQVLPIQKEIEKEGVRL